MAKRRSDTLPGVRQRLAVVLCAVLLAHGTDGAAAVPSGPSAGPAVRSQRLAVFVPTPGPMDLRGDRGEGGLWFNLSTRVEPTAATLHLELSNSQALLAPRSQLSVRLNDAVVAQITLRPGAPITVADIDLPPELLRGGSNHLSFVAAQHYTNDCENPAAAELWSQIDTTRSRLSISGRPVAVSSHLADLPDLIGPGFFGGHRFTFMTAGVQTTGGDAPLSGRSESPLDDDAVQAGAAIAQALGLRLRYQAPSIDYAEARPTAESDDASLHLQPPPAAGPGDDVSDIVLFGTASSLAPLLGSDLAEAVEHSHGGFLGLRALPSDRNRLVLVVSGATPADVRRAAEALAVEDFPFVDAAEQSVETLALRSAAAPTLANGATTTLSALGLPAVTLRGPAGTASFEAVIPADYYVPDSAEAELSLDFAYGAGLRSDSAVNLLLNGQFIQALALPDPNGAVLRGYKVRLPARKLRPGRNSIAFETVLTPSVSGSCIAPQTRNLVLSIAGSSTLALPHGDHLTAQPDLGLFATTGFPYVNAGAPFDVALPSNDAATVSSGWMVLARLAQLAGRMMPEAHTVLGPPAAGRSALVVGAAADLPPDLLAAAPIAVGTEASLPFAASGIRPAERPEGWAEKVRRIFGISARADEGDEAASPGVARVRGKASLGRNGLFTAFRAPGAGDATVTVLTASARPELWRATEAAVSPAVWGQIGGDVSVWRPGSGTVSAQRAGSTFHVGSRSTLYAARYYVGEYPVAWIAALLGSAVMLALVSWLFLSRRLRRRYPGSKEGVP